MRNWMRERMKRRKKKTQENESEATGKVGQQKPPVDELHPEPLKPSYETSDSEPQGDDDAGAPEMDSVSPDAGRMETEVQPETPSTPPPGVLAHQLDRSSLGNTT